MQRFVSGTPLQPSPVSVFLGACGANPPTHAVQYPIQTEAGRSLWIGISDVSPSLQTPNQSPPPPELQKSLYGFVLLCE